jgi:hypothetical protein
LYERHLGFCPRAKGRCKLDIILLIAAIVCALPLVVLPIVKLLFIKERNNSSNLPKGGNTSAPRPLPYGRTSRYPPQGRTRQADQRRPRPEDTVSTDLTSPHNPASPLWVGHDTSSGKGSDCGPSHGANTSPSSDPSPSGSDFSGGGVDCSPAGD